MTMSTLRRFAGSFALIALLVLSSIPRVQTQARTLLFGSFNNTAKVLSVDTSGNVNAVVSGGTVAAANGGTGQSSYAVGDMLYASGSTALSKLADVAAGSFLRSGGVTTAPVWSMTTWPNTATTGDLVAANAANGFTNLAAVATGQVLASAGTSTLPAYTATPSVTSVTVKAGTGTGTMKTGGALCSTIAGTCGCTTFTDAGVQNQWNVLSCTIPASSLAVNGDELQVEVAFDAAANANTKEVQAFWNGGTCSGTGAAMCATGTTIWGAGVTTATSGNSIVANILVRRRSSSNQDIFSKVFASTAMLVQGGIADTITDTNTIALAFGIRNTSAAAASTKAPTPVMRVEYRGQ